MFTKNRTDMRDRCGIRDRILVLVATFIIGAVYNITVFGLFFMSNKLLHSKNKSEQSFCLLY